MKWGYVESPFQVISNFCLEFKNKEILKLLLLISNLFCAFYKSKVFFYK